MQLEKNLKPKELNVQKVNWNNDWTEKDQLKYKKYFEEHVDNLKSIDTIVMLDLIGFDSSKPISLMKIRMVVTSDIGDFNVNTLIYKTPHKYNADCASYMKAVDADGWETLDVKVRFADVLKKKHMDELNDAIQFELELQGYSEGDAE